MSNTLPYILKVNEIIEGNPIRQIGEEPLGNTQVDLAQEARAVLQSWTGAFSYVQEDPSTNVKGLRKPQIGAIHAVHAHWSVSDQPATIVMPTGTGKTEVMLSILVSVRCPKLMVVVPTDALRTQIAEKFLTLGILKDSDCKVLANSAKNPVVAVLKHIPRTLDEVDSVFEPCNVIVTTSSIAGQCKVGIQKRMAQHCSYLFIDEAHHAEAPTWRAFKQQFSKSMILQFTATPFREDGKPLDGEIIYKYSLKKAQEDGYFQPIQFLPVVEFNRKISDEAIATKAIEQLRKDVDKGHILMARVDSVTRAGEIFKLYEPYGEFKPVQLHTGIHSARKRAVAREQIIKGESRIVVCVDMLGEGFDLPELKIAAFHDIRKSLAVTLQLAGRFTRSNPKLGKATFIANTADIHVRDELRKLYARDPDWNVLLPELSEQMIGEQVSLQEFLRGFTDFAVEIPLKAVRPAMSTVVYRTKCKDWTPEKFRDGIPSINTCEQVLPAINQQKRTLVVVTARRVPLDWANIENLYGWEWELYVVIWSPDQNLLFINSSTNSGEYLSLAKAVAGDQVLLIKGQEVFRTFAGVNRLFLQNVGLTEQLGRNVRYTGRMGVDVGPAVSDLQRKRTIKSVLSGTGFENGQRVTVGASRKGRIWSHQRERIDQLVAWCKSIGSKLLDNTINPDEVLKGTLEAKTVTTRPAKQPIGIDWPEEIYKSPESMWTLIFSGDELSLSETSIELTTPNQSGPLRFRVSSENNQTEFELRLFDSEAGPNYEFVHGSGESSQIKRSARAQPEDLIEFFYENPPIIWFADGSSLEGNQYVELKADSLPFDRMKIDAWDWDGIDIRKESQGKNKDASSIQARVIQSLNKSGHYDVVFDDDGKGEIADIVAIRLVGDKKTPSKIAIEFYHCKYAHGNAAGHRLSDLYEVCGQAQKSISWMASAEKRIDIFTHLLRREAKRRELGIATRLEAGTVDLLSTIREMSQICPVSLKVYIVQPGLSKANASADQLLILSVVENYLFETYQLQFGVISNN